VRIRHGEPLHFAIEVQVDEADEWHRGEDAIRVAFASVVGAIVESTTDGPEHKRGRGNRSSRAGASDACPAPAQLDSTL
jgi:hypothetical protein